MKGIEEASNHRLVKSELLEVITDINVALNVQTKGFDLLNESQQVKTYHQTQTHFYSLLQALVKNIIQAQEVIFRPCLHRSGFI